MRRCYIVVRQLFYLSNGVHYQVADDNPVREVFTSEQAAIDWVRSYIQSYIKQTYIQLQFFEERCDSELVYKAGAFNPAGYTALTYNVIKKGLIE